MNFRTTKTVFFNSISRKVSSQKEALNFRKNLMRSTAFTVELETGELALFYQQYSIVEALTRTGLLALFLTISVRF